MLRSLSLLAVLAVFILSPAMSAGAVILSFTPPIQSAMPTDSISVDLVIDGLAAGGPDSLGAFDIDVTFNPAALTLTGFSLTSLLGDVGLGEAFDSSFGLFAPGHVNVSLVSLLEADGSTCVSCVPPYLDDIQPASFPLASFDFTVDSLAAGSSTFVTVDTVYGLADAFGASLTLAGLSDAVIENQSAPAVPEPGTLVLMAIGALSAGITRARRRR